MIDSIWENHVADFSHKELLGNLKAEVAIIGGGMAGILTAYKLKKQGVKPIIIEANMVGGGTSLGTTGKITSQHRLKISYIKKNYGERFAKQYYNANMQAVLDYEEIIKENSIKCDFKKLTNYVYTLSDEEKISEEIQVCKELGIKVEKQQKIELPFPIASCAFMENQAQFDPQKFIFGLKDHIDIYENTRVVDIQENMIITKNGSKIVADKIVLCCGFPFINIPGYYFLKMFRSRSYLVAFSGATTLNGMYIDESVNGYSFRSYNGLLLVGGGSHKTGKDHDGKNYDNIINMANSLYPGLTPVKKWSTQDCMTIDDIPYIGQFSKSTQDVFIATGFSKWGMSTSMVAANIISDMILGKKNENADVFSPSRFKILPSIKNIAASTGQAVVGLAMEKLRIPAYKIKDIQPGHGAIVYHKGKKIGVYVEDDGTTHQINTKCPHLGCELSFNPDEKSWDCPCHGSRFSYDGTLLDGPATKGIRYEKF